MKKQWLLVLACIIACFTSIAQNAAEFKADFYIYFNIADNSLAEKTLQNLQNNDDSDQNSVATDPLFVAIEHGDFSFQPNSPVLKMGIIPIDVSKIGLQKF